MACEFDRSGVRRTPASLVGVAWVVLIGALLGSRFGAFDLSQRRPTYFVDFRLQLRLRATELKWVARFVFYSFANFILFLLTDFCWQMRQAVCPIPKIKSQL